MASLSMEKTAISTKEIRIINITHYYYFLTPRLPCFPHLICICIIQKRKKVLISWRAPPFCNSSLFGEVKNFMKINYFLCIAGVRVILLCDYIYSSDKSVQNFWRENTFASEMWWSLFLSSTACQYRLIKPVGKALYISCSCCYPWMTFELFILLSEKRHE